MKKIASLIIIPILMAVIPFSVAFGENYTIIAPGEPSEKVSEELTCVFNNSTTKQECYSATGGNETSFSCSGTNACTMNASGLRGQKMTWKSTCGQYAYSTFDGTKETLQFKCQPGPTNIMTIKSVEWLPGIEESNGDKLLKAKVDFHYEGDFIELHSDYYFDIHCSMTPLRRRGGYKTLFQETRDLSSVDNPEIEGPADFQHVFTFTFYPHEFKNAQRRGISCSLSNSTGKGGSGLVHTRFGDGVKTGGYKIKARPEGWTVLN